MSAGSLAILADYEDDDTDAEDNTHPNSQVQGNNLRGYFTVSQDGRCPRCETSNVLFVILDELFPTGDMPEILYTLIAKGKAVLWSSQDKKGCKDPPTFLCRGFCPPDPLGAGFNINWSKNTLEDIFFPSNTDSLAVSTASDPNSQPGMYEYPNDEKTNKTGVDADLQESSRGSNNQNDDDYDDDDENEEEDGDNDDDDDDDDDEIDEDELIKQMLAKEARKTQESSDSDSVQPSVMCKVLETESLEQTPSSEKTRTVYYTTSSTDIPEDKDVQNDSTPVSNSSQCSFKPNKNHQYPVSSDGSCPFCTSKNVQYIIVCSSDMQDKNLPYTLRELLKRGQAFKMAKGENDPPSFLCQGCQYGFNLDWSVTNLELIFGIPKKPSKAAAAKFHNQASTTHPVAPHMGYPPPRVPPVVPPANIHRPTLPPRGYPPPFPPPSVPPPGLAPPASYPLPPPRMPPPRAPPPYMPPAGHTSPRVGAPTGHFPPPPGQSLPRLPPPGRVPSVIPPPPPGQVPPRLPPPPAGYVPPRLPPAPPPQGFPRHPPPGVYASPPRAPPLPVGQYPRVPPRYPPPVDYQYGYHQPYGPPAGYPPMQAGYPGYPEYGHGNQYYPQQIPHIPPPPPPAYGHHPGYLATMPPPGFQQPPAPGTQYYPPGRPPTSHPLPYQRPHNPTYSGHTVSKTDTQSLPVDEKDKESKDKDQVIGDEKTLEDSHRFEELLNQIDHNRGITSSQKVSLDVDLSQNEPNSISEEHGDAEYDERPPGDEDDETPEFGAMPSVDHSPEKVKSKVETGEPIADLVPSGQVLDVTTSNETQETNSSYGDKNDTAGQKQAEESEEVMETSEETVLKETVAKKTVVKRVTKGRRGRKRKAAEERNEDENIAKQQKVTDESSQEEEGKKMNEDDGITAKEDAEQENVMNESSKANESEEILAEKESKKVTRRGRRKRTTQSMPAQKDEISESPSNKLEERKEACEPDITEPPENTRPPEDKNIAEKQKVTEESSQEEEDEKMNLDDVTKKINAEQQEDILTEKVSKKVTRRGRKRTTQSVLAQKDEVSEPDSTEPSENERLSEQERDETAVQNKTVRSRKMKGEIQESSESSSGVEALTPTAASTRQRKGKSRPALPVKEAETRDEALQQVDSKPTAHPTRQRRGRSQAGVGKENESEMEVAEIKQLNPEEFIDKTRTLTEQDESGEPATTESTAPCTTTRLQKGNSDVKTAMNFIPDKALQNNLELHGSSSEEKGAGKEKKIRVRKRRGKAVQTDKSQRSDEEAPSYGTRASTESESDDKVVPAERRSRRSLRGSSAIEDITKPEPTDSQQSQPEPPAERSAVRRGGRSLRGSSAEDDTSKAEPIESQETETSLTDVSASSDTEHNSNSTRRSKRSKKEVLENDSNSLKAEEECANELLVIKDPLKTQSFDTSKDFDSDGNTKEGGKTLQARNTGSKDDTEGSSGEVDTSALEKPNVLGTKSLREASSNIEESTDSSVTADDAASSEESTHRSVRGSKKTPAKSSRVLRKRN